MSSATGDPRVRPRLAVLGADGFIGSRVAAAAQAAGADVTAICVRPPWRLEGVLETQARTVHVPRGRWWEGDGQAAIAVALADADALVLLAYEAPPDREGEAALEHERAVNLAGAESVARIAADLGVRVVFASSADVYGPWSDSPVTEHTAPGPATPYAIAKLEAERLVADACRPSRGSVSLRLSTIFGPHEHAARAIPAFIRALRAGERPIVHGDGSDVRDYAYVDDVAEAVVRCALDPRAFSTSAPVVNVGSGVGRTTLDVLSAVGAVLGLSVEARHVPSARPPSRLVVDPARARSLLGLENRTSFHEGLRLEAGGSLAPAPEAVAMPLVAGRASGSAPDPKYSNPSVAK